MCSSKSQTWRKVSSVFCGVKERLVNMKETYELSYRTKTLSRSEFEYPQDPLRTPRAYYAYLSKSLRRTDGLKSPQYDSANRGLIKRSLDARCSLFSAAEDPEMLQGSRPGV
jgi:hypothetical protein